MIDKYIDDYYRSRIGMKELSEKLNKTPNVVYRMLRERNLEPRGRYYKQIDTGIPELDKSLRIKYNDIIQRSRGRKGLTYINNAKSDNYITIIEWVDIINEHKSELIEMWKQYINSGKQKKKSISVDRIDNSLPYYRDNIAFETTGFNAWKRNIRPIKVTVDNESRHFMSAEEASNYYGIRRQSIGDILRGRNKYNGKYEAVPSSVEEVLKSHELTDIGEYYNHILKG